MAWDAMVALGAYHGINPGMGWLFAVALGMQQGSARGVWRALPPIALGHAMAVGLVLLAAALAGLIVPLETMKVIVAGMLMTLGLYRLWRHRHPRYAGMQVTFGTLTVWSFLMASAHGAGFMVLPFVMRMPGAVSAATGEHAGHRRRGGGKRAVDERGGRRRSHAGVSAGDDAVRVDRVSQAGSEAASHGVVQPGLAVGRRAGGDWRSRAPDVTKR